MKKQFLFLFSFIMVIAGCSNDQTLFFSGESDNWKGEYSANISDNETREDGKYIFGYKSATNDTSLKNLEIIINDGETKWQENNLKGATVAISLSCSSCAVTNEDSLIKVTIKWNDEKQESFMLKSK